MNRRLFIRVLLATGATMAIGGLKLLQKIGLRRFTWAERAKRFPGKIIRISEIQIRKISSWSG